METGNGFNFDYFPGDGSDGEGESKKYKRKDAMYQTKRLKLSLSPVQAKELIEKAYEKSEKHGLIIEFQLKTGLRIDEVVNMTVQNVDLNSFFVLVSYVPDSDETKEWKGKTASSYRQVKLNRELAKKMKDYLEREKIKNGYIFRPGGRETRYNKRSVINLVNAIACECTSIGKKIGTHTLRRTFASFLLKSKVPITTIQQLLGHKNLKTTFEYLKDVFDPQTDGLVEMATESIGKTT